MKMPMRGPVCKKPTTWQGNPLRPFCSERCRLIDLDNWLSERYRISSAIEPDEEGESEMGQPERAADEEHGG